MLVAVGKKDLARMAARMAAIAERKATMPVLANVVLSADGGKLHLGATDLYQSLLGSVVADVAKPGSVAVSARDFIERVKMMPDGPITLTLKDTSLAIHTKGSARKYSLRAMPGDDFPPLPRPSADAASLTIEAGVLSDLAARMHYAVSPDETRPHINSALFEWDGETVRMVGTDGHRLSKVERTIEGRPASLSMLLPLKALSELRRMTDEDSERTIKIIRNDSMAFFDTGEAIFGVKLVDATFPPYAQVIPTTSKTVARLPRTSFADAVRAVAIASSELVGGIELEFSDGRVKITSASPDKGDGSDEVPVEMTGPGVRIGVTARHILDVLGSLADEHIQIALSAELDPIVITPVNATGLTAVVMPLRI